MRWRLTYETNATPNGSASSPSAQAIPVTLGTSEKKDVPVYLTALGNVQGFNTVTVKVRVDCQLVKVAFKEGQNVKEGDLLAQIDPQEKRNYDGGLCNRR